MSPSRESRPKNASSDTLIRTPENSGIVLPEKPLRKEVPAFLVDPQTGELVQYILRDPPGFLWGEKQEHKYIISLQEAVDIQHGVALELNPELIDTYNANIGLSPLRLSNFIKEIGGFDECSILIKKPSRELHNADEKWVQEHEKGDLLQMRIRGRSHQEELFEAFFLFDYTQLNALMAFIEVADKYQQNGIGRGVKRVFLGFCDHSNIHTADIYASNRLGAFFHAYEYTPHPKEYAALKRSVKNSEAWKNPILVEDNPSNRDEIQKIKDDFLKAKNPAYLRKFTLLKTPLVIFEGVQMPFTQSCLLYKRWEGRCDFQNLADYTRARIRARNFENALLIPATKDVKKMLISAWK